MPIVIVTVSLRASGWEIIMATNAAMQRDQSVYIALKMNNARTINAMEQVEIRNAPTKAFGHPVFMILIVPRAGVKIMSARQLYQWENHVLTINNARTINAMEQVEVRNAPTKAMAHPAINILTVPRAGVKIMSARQLYQLDHRVLKIVSAQITNAMEEMEEGRNAPTKALAHPAIGILTAPITNAVVGRQTLRNAQMAM